MLNISLVGLSIIGSIATAPSYVQPGIGRIVVSGCIFSRYFSSFLRLDPSHNLLVKDTMFNRFLDTPLKLISDYTPISKLNYQNQLMIYYSGNTLVIDCKFIDCQAPYNNLGAAGGGIFFLCQPKTDEFRDNLNVTSCYFSNCTAQNGGGGIYCSGVSFYSTEYIGLLSVIDSCFYRCRTSSNMNDKSVGSAILAKTNSLYISQNSLIGCGSLIEQFGSVLDISNDQGELQSLNFSHRKSKYCGTYELRYIKKFKVSYVNIDNITSSWPIVFSYNDYFENVHILEFCNIINGNYTPEDNADKCILNRIPTANNGYITLNTLCVVKNKGTVNTLINTNYYEISNSVLQYKGSQTGNNNFWEFTGSASLNKINLDICSEYVHFTLSNSHLIITNVITDEIPMTTKYQKTSAHAVKTLEKSNQIKPDISRSDSSYGKNSIDDQNQNDPDADHPSLSIGKIIGIAIAGVVVIILIIVLIIFFSKKQSNDTTTDDLPPIFQGVETQISSQSYNQTTESTLGKDDTDNDEIFRYEESDANNNDGYVL